MKPQNYEYGERKCTGYNFKWVEEERDPKTSVGVKNMVYTLYKVALFLTPNVTFFYINLVFQITEIVTFTEMFKEV